MARRALSRARALRTGLTLAVLGSSAVAALALPAGAGATGLAQSNCRLAGPYKHVIYVQYDNTHLRRDNPNVPSDLQQIPNLKNFLTSNGTLLNNDHTILISHTAGGIVSSLSGLYPDHNGITESNSQIQYTNNGQSSTFPSGFSYWTDPTSTSDSTFNLLTSPGTNTPAPWVPYTRAGCDVGAFSIANMELENTDTSSSGDITTVFGPNSPQATFSNWSNNSGFGSPDMDNDNDGDKDGNAAVANFEGIAVHCAQADSGATTGLCSKSSGGEPDVLPSEPGGYTGYNGLFGGLYANQVVSKPGSFTPATASDDGSASTPGGPGINFNDVAPTVNDVYNYNFSGCQFCAGGPQGPASSAPIQDNTGNSGFPGFDPSAAQTLGYVASMQESGIPVTYAYIADAHDNHSSSSDMAFGPGQAGYVAQLKAENQAYGAFFERLAKDGINKSNTLFVFTVDEGDHFAGGPPTNPGCDGVTTPCQYTAGSTGPNTIGEQTTQMDDLLAKEKGNTTPFDITFDDAPAFQVHANGIPGPYDSSVRTLERDASSLTVQNQRTGATDTVTQHIADQSDLGILHMINVDPLRRPSFVLFGNPDYFFQTGGCPSTSTTPGCPVVDNGFAWNHGDDNPEIGHTWVGYVGPTVQHFGETGALWTDHTDVRPTMLQTLGLADDYMDDGNATSAILDPSSLPQQLRGHLFSYEALDQIEKQLNAPFGQFGHDSEIVSTTAVESNSPGDAVDKGFDQQLNTCDAARNALVSQLQPMLQQAEFGGGTINQTQAVQLFFKAARLIADMHSLSQMTTPPSQPVCG